MSSQTPPVKFKTARQLYNYVAEFYNLLDTEIDNYISRERLHIACHKGCGICCHIKVDINAHEILYIAHYLETSLSEDMKAAVLNDLKKSATAIAPLNARDHFLGRFKCGFLQDGCCAVHPARPSMCRKFNSLSLDGCKQIFRAGGKPLNEGPENYELDKLAANLIKTFDLNFKTSGYDAATYEINQAVLMTLNHKGCMENWLVGQKMLPSQIEAKKFSPETRKKIMERRAALHNNQTKDL